MNCDREATKPHSGWQRGILFRNHYHTRKSTTTQKRIHHGPQAVYTQSSQLLCTEKSLKGNIHGSGESSSANLTRFFRKADLGDKTLPESQRVKNLIRYPGQSDSKGGVSVAQLNRVLAETGLGRSIFQTSHHRDPLLLVSPTFQGTLIHQMFLDLYDTLFFLSESLLGETILIHAATVV